MFQKLLGLLKTWAMDGRPYCPPSGTGLLLVTFSSLQFLPTAIYSKFVESTVVYYLVLFHVNTSPFHNSTNFDC